MADRFTLARASSPHTSPRSTRPLYLVVHRMQGTLEGSLSWFANSQSKVSADVCVSREGDRVVVVNPPASGRYCWAVGNGNPYCYSYEIEGHVGDEDTLPENLFDTLAARMAADARALAAKYGGAPIPLVITATKGAAGITGHKQVGDWYGGTNHICPGRFPWGRLRDAISERAQPTIEPVDYLVVGVDGPPARIVSFARYGEGRAKRLIDDLELVNMANRHGRIVIVKQARRRQPQIGSEL